MKRLDQIPTATYRLQLNRHFTFRDAAAIVPYLSSLGISHCYASPYLRARPGSLHGYDIIDHNALNPEIGTREDYEQFVEALHQHGMRQILDIVPNHMGVMGSDNSWWLDVLENGEASDYAEFFDIDWYPIKDELQGKVLVPVLADQYGTALEKGDLKLTFDAERGEFSIFYFQHRFPIAPREYPRILRFEIKSLQEKLGATHEDALELQSIITAFNHLPGRQDTTPEQRAERNREKEVQKRRLAALCARSTNISDFISANVERIHGKPDDPRSFDTLHELIKAQPYRFAQWRVAADDINYRRFFDINELAALRTENEAVFSKTHQFIFELVSKGYVDGLRIDHPDGLYDPGSYLQQLHDRLKAELDPQDREAYVIVEKIVTGKERLREEWPVDGTTGYEFANLVNGLFVDRAAADQMERIYRSFTGVSTDLADLVYQCKKLILKVVLASELTVLANMLSKIALANRYTCDFTLNGLRSALAETIANFTVYRTYVNGCKLSEEDRPYVAVAIRAAKRRSNAADLSIFDFIRHMLLVEVNGTDSGWYKHAVLRFAMKFQQVTAAVMAKGLEDTAFYRYNRLISLNEVGGDPSRFGTTVDEFHQANQERLSRWPDSMLESSTHDSKRSEDLRARINVLSEIPKEWQLHLRRWRDWNRGKKRMLDDAPAPNRNDEYLLYQTLIGTWPAESLDDSRWDRFVKRIEQYMLKAVREAKEHTSWAHANADYEEAVTGFVHSVLERSERNRFLAHIEKFQRRVSRIGIFNSLSQALLKMTSPGVPDIYQGNELLHYALVDPDNREPVDYDVRKKAMGDLLQQQQSPESVSKLLELPNQHLAKLYLTWKTLTFRKVYPTLFQRGDYVSLAVSGQRASHVIAFARRREGRTVIVAVPRLCAKLLGDSHATICDAVLWGDTAIELPDFGAPCYHNVLTGECIPAGTSGEQHVPVANFFRHFPAALLVSEMFNSGASACV
jgi:(1->4)-alpha-D-glucan 1-alpha-D-glucosylmutase